MIGSDRRLFDKALTKIAIATREKVTDEIFDLYFDALSDLSIDSLIPAMENIYKTAKFFPRVGEIREHAAPVIPPYRQKFLDGEPVKQISGASQKPHLTNGATPNSNLKSLVGGLGRAEG